MREKFISGATNHLIFPNRLKSSGNKQVERDRRHLKDGSLTWKIYQIQNERSLKEFLAEMLQKN